MKRWLYLAAGLLAVFAFRILGGPARAEVKAKLQRDDLLLVGSSKAKAKARKRGIKADMHQADALEAELVGKATVDRIGTQGETISSILDSFRKPDSV